MKYPKLRELKEAVIALIKGPATAKYPFEPHVPPEGFRGRPAPSDEGCIACGACAEVCPVAAIKITDAAASSQPSRRVEWYYDKCIFCGQCERNCTTRDEVTPGVKLTREFDLASTDRSTLRASVSKEMVACDCCGELIAARPHLKWLAARLGPLSAGLLPLNYLYQRELLHTKSVRPSRIETGRLHRQDIFQINCPKCRHTVLVFNQTGK